MSVLDQIRKLDEQKKKLLDDAKNEALAKAQQAISELNELGFNYRLVEGSGRANSSASRASGGTRRTGIRDDVLKIVTDAGPDGIAPAGIREQLNIPPQDKSAMQSVANALSALKRNSKIADKNGAYVAA